MAGQILRGRGLLLHLFLVSFNPFPFSTSVAVCRPTLEELPNDSLTNITNPWATGNGTENTFFTTSWELGRVYVCIVPSTTSLRLSAMCSTGFQSVNGYYTRSLLPPSTWHWPDILQARLHAGRRRLCSAERCDMLVPRTRTELRRRSFQVAAPTIWNSLPAHLRSTLISRRQFRDGLKSHLFTGAYFWSSANICFKSVIYLLTYLYSTGACLTVVATECVSTVNHSYIQVTERDTYVGWIRNVKKWYTCCISSCEYGIVRMIITRSSRSSGMPCGATRSSVPLQRQQHTKNQPNERTTLPFINN